MTLTDDLSAEVTATFKSQWSLRQGLVVPEPDALQLGNDAVEFARATVLFADLSSSTAMVDTKAWQFSAEVYKTYLHCAARLIRSEGGTITSYDGDRVMGIWIDDSQSTSAVRCGLKINYAVHKIINPALRAQYPTTDYEVKQVVGIDTSPLRAARTGVRGGNDLVWVGRAANYAAKLTNLNLDERTWITQDVFASMADNVKNGGSSNQSMWKPYTWNQQGGHQIHGSTWWWVV
jgi:class 3 adenylate cyclase